MKSIKDILEQHREEGRFKPVKPHNVPSVAVVSPRATSDSASSSVKEEKQMKDKDPCWKGYQMVGMKDKNGKKVPNCVPEEVQQEGAVPAKEKIITVKHKESGKTLRISANAASKYRTMGYHYHPTNEEVEQIEELSNATLRGYADKARTDIQKTLPKLHTDAKAAGRIDKRVAGLAASTVAKVKNNLKKEETEQIDEISDSTAANYVRKRSLGYAKKTTPDSNGNVQPSAVLNKMSDKHKAGISRAMDRLMKPVKEARSADSDGGPPTPAAATLTVTGQPKLSKVPGETKLVPLVHEGKMKDTVINKQEDERLAKQKGSWKVETPWTKVKGTGTVTDKSGAKHTPMSRARDLARQAFRRKVTEQSNVKPNPFTVPATNPGQSPSVKAETEFENKKRKDGIETSKPKLSESRQLEIVREAMKDAKQKDLVKKKNDEVEKGGKDKFIADPELTSQITKSNP